MFFVFVHQDYISQVEPIASMGLSVDSIHSYSINQSRRVLGDEAPESAPCDCLIKGAELVTVALKGKKLTLSTCSTQVQR